MHVKVTDFGLSKLQDRFTTLRVGSTLWMAPEVFGVDNMAYTNSADVYSFAMVFFEVLTGEIPFADVQQTDFYEKIKIGVRPILPSKADFPSYLSAFIERCWATRAEDRPKFPEICQIFQDLPCFFCGELFCHIGCQLCTNSIPWLCHGYWFYCFGSHQI